MDRSSLPRLRKLPSLNDRIQAKKLIITQKSAAFYTPPTLVKISKKAVKRASSYSPTKPRKTPGSLIATTTVKEVLKCSFSLDHLEMTSCLGLSKVGRVMLAKVGYKEYAVKVIAREAAKYAFNEAYALEKLHHQLIVEYYGCLHDSSNFYLVLEYLSGGDLFSLMQKTRLNKQQVKQIAAEVAAAINQVHRSGLVYRDLKPENVMLSFEGHVKVIDFGTAKELKKDERTFTLCGSPHYLAPEMITMEGHGRPVDWWALGAMIFEMSTGHPPFRGSSPQKLNEAILSSEVVFPRSVDECTRQLIKRLLNKDPYNRIDFEGLKSLEYFQDVDWNAVCLGKLESKICPAVLKLFA